MKAELIFPSFRGETGREGAGANGFRNGFLIPLHFLPPPQKFEKSPSPRNVLLAARPRAHYKK